MHKMEKIDENNPDNIKEEEEEDEVDNENDKNESERSVRFSFRVEKDVPPLMLGDDDPLPLIDDDEIEKNLKNLVIQTEEELEVEKEEEAVQECTLEGVVLQRKARSATSRYKKCYLVLDLLNENLTCYKDPPVGAEGTTIPTRDATRVGSEGSTHSSSSDRSETKKTSTGSNRSISSPKQSMMNRIKKAVAFGHSHKSADSLATSSTHSRGRRRNKSVLDKQISGLSSDDDIKIAGSSSFSDDDELSTISSSSGATTTTMHPDTDARDHTVLSIVGIDDVIENNDDYDTSSSSCKKKEKRSSMFKSPPLWTISSDVNWLLRDVINDNLMFQIILPDNYDLATSTFLNDHKGTSLLGGGTIIEEEEERNQVLQFKCQVIGNEKHLWLRAASSLNRLATLVSTCTCPIERAKRRNVFRRVRTPTSASLSDMARDLEDLHMMKGLQFGYNGGSSSTLSESKDESYRSSKWLQSSSSSTSPRRPEPQRNKSMMLRKSFALLKSTKSFKNIIEKSTATSREEEELLKLIQQLTKLNLIDDENEHKLLPTYAYPHRWMTEKEMFYEQIKPSVHFHDLHYQYEQQQRQLKLSQSCSSRQGIGRAQLGPIIGKIQIEILSCIGLKKKSKKNDANYYNTSTSQSTASARSDSSSSSSTTTTTNKNSSCNKRRNFHPSKKQKKRNKYNTVCYIVSGTYGFTTDVIPKKSRPMWLPKARRACIIPLHHTYAKVYIGVFDDQGEEKNNKEDDFLGRVVLDVARLRPNCIYDVKLPLRLYSTIYSPVSHGLVRVRLKLNWEDDRKALLSYWKKPTVPPPTTTTTTNSAEMISASDPKENPPPPESAPPRPGLLPPKRKDLSKRLRQEKKALSSTSHKTRTPPVTICCADAKAFRNVVLTIQGMTLPEGYSRKVMTCALREYKLYQKAIVNALKSLPKHIKTWENPALSFFIFVAWMHIVYSQTLSLLPQYMISCLIFALLRNYVHYGAGSRVHNGFSPVSLEELVRVLVFGESVKPLELHGMLAADYVKMDGQFGISMDHMEFPFSEGGRYPKKTLADACLFSSNQSLRGKCQFAMNALLDDKEEDESSDDDYEEEEEEEEENSEGFSTAAPSERSVFSNTSTYLPPVLENDSKESSSSDYERMDAQSSKRNNLKHKNETENVNMLGGGSGHYRRGELWKMGNAALPEQDIHRKTAASSKTKLSDEMVQLREKLHDGTLRLFDDHSYYIAQSPPPASSMAKSTTNNGVASVYEKEGEKIEGDVNSPPARELDKILGINTSSNILVSKLAEFVTPITQIIMIQNCSFRAGFNMFMWRDPYLSFWALVVCIFVLFVSMVFPWRLFLFALGVFYVGPQNWLLRKIKQGQKSGKKTKMGKEQPSTVTQQKAVTKGNSNVEAISSRDTEHVNVHILPQESHIQKKGYTIMKRKKGPKANFTVAPSSPALAHPADFALHSHLYTNDGKNMKQGAPVSNTYDAVVPYSPLLHIRFYDWPPERMHTSVKVCET